jgi:hypothetical protein
MQEFSSVGMVSPFGEAMRSLIRRVWHYLTNAAACPTCGGRSTFRIHEETVEMFNRRSYRIPTFMAGRSTGAAFHDINEERWRGIERCRTCGCQRCKVWKKTYEE